MSDHGERSRVSDVAASRVESILAAAEAAAKEIKKAADGEADELRATGRREAGRELELARKKAIELGADARREAKLLVDEATKESAQLREQTRRQTEGKVSAAEEAAAQVLDEAKTLSAGLRQLGGTLQAQGEHILRDVLAAHKRMQADLRVASPADPPRRSETPRRSAPRRASEPAPERLRPASGSSGSSATPAERAAIERAAAELDEEPSPRSNRDRDNPFDDLDVPSWVEN